MHSILAKKIQTKKYLIVHLKKIHCFSTRLTTTKILVMKVFVVLLAIWYHLRNLINAKNTHGEGLL